MIIWAVTHNVVVHLKFQRYITFTICFPEVHPVIGLRRCGIQRNRGTTRPTGVDIAALFFFFFSGSSSGSSGSAPAQRMSRVRVTHLRLPTFAGGTGPSRSACARGLAPLSLSLSLSWWQSPPAVLPVMR